MISNMGRLTRQTEEHAPSQTLGASDYLSLLEATPEMVAIIDGQGRIIFVNSQLKKFLDRSDSELIGADFGILPIFDDDNAEALARSGIELTHWPQPNAVVRSCHILKSDGSEVPVDVSIGTAQTQSGPIFIVVLHDRSDAGRRELGMREFFAAANHELRTPLASIVGALSLLKANAVGQLPEPAEKMVKIAHANSQRLTRLINELLEIHRLETGKIPLHLELVELSALVEGEIEKIQGVAKPSNVGVRFDYTGPKLTIITDAHRLGQVLTNLLSNAVKYSPKGSEVVVSLEEHGNRVRISVHDHGRGIPPEHKQRIFEKFAQVKSDDAYVMGGAGLGLYITKEIVRSLGGNIDLQSEVGAGTIFRVDLPKAPPERAAVS